jgi:hypothetical protein
MPFGLRLWLLLWIAGCAEQALLVPESDWQTVPPAQRAAIDRKYEADLAASRAELAAATKSLGELPRTPPPPPPAPAPAGARPSAPASAPSGDDPWQTAMRDHEHARADARGRVETTRVEAQRTDAAWRQLRFDTAQAEVDMLVAQREAIRAQAINRNLPGDDTYDSAPLRGQFSRAQQRWYAISTRARAARDAYERATTDLASAKEAYAQIMRNGPAHLRQSLPSDDHTAHLELAGWVVLRSDLRHRRGPGAAQDDVPAEPHRAHLAARARHGPERRARASRRARHAADSRPRRRAPAGDRACREARAAARIVACGGASGRPCRRGHRARCEQQAGGDASAATRAPRSEARVIAIR